MPSLRSFFRNIAPGPVPSLVLIQALVLIPTLALIPALSPVLASSGETDDFEILDDKAIYGEDDRYELFQASNSLKQVARSVAAVFPYESLDYHKSGHYLLPKSPTGRDRNWCADEPFYRQPAGAVCTAFVVGKRLIATAGHCVQDDNDLGNAPGCKNIAFVFGYQMQSSQKAIDKIDEANVYFCQQVLAGKYSPQGEDWRLIRTDRDIKQPVLSIQSPGQLQEGSDIAVVGYPMGLPAKVADSATVTEQRKPYFFNSNLDVFQGNSGSPVFDRQQLSAGKLMVSGMLVRGEAVEFKNPEGGNCIKSRRCQPGECRGEEIMDASVLQPAVKRLSQK